MNDLDKLIQMLREPPICPECSSFLEQKNRVTWVCPECGYIGLDEEELE